MSRAEDILEQLNTLDEHSALEAKSGVGSSVLETICAFANEPGLDGGTIVIGVRCNEDLPEPVYEVIGVDQPDKVSSDLASQCASVFNVPLRPRIVAERINGKTVLIVDVSESGSNQKPVYIKRKGVQHGAFRRIGSTDQLCNEDDIALLYGSRNAHPFDQTVLPNATFEDLDPEAVEYYRTLRAKVNSQAEELSYSDPELLQALRAVDATLQPTLTGILLFGKKIALRRLLPVMRIDYIRVPGLQWIEDPHNRFTSIDMRGPLLQLVRRAQDSVIDDLPRRFHLEEGAVQADAGVIPADVIREAIVNAVMHASYRVHRPIQIIRYANRIEIINPGYSLKREDLLGLPGSDPRNPSLAAVFHETNLAETKGTGIRTMRRLMKEAGFAPPLFHSDRANNLFTITLRLHHFLAVDDLAWLRSLHCDDLTDSQKYALTIVRDTGMIDNSLYRQNSDCDTLKASRELKKLCELGFLEMRGRGSATYYVRGPKLIFQEKADRTELDEFTDGAGSVSTRVTDLAQAVTDPAATVTDPAQPVKDPAAPETDPILLKIARPAHEKKRLPPETIEQIVRRLCQGRFLTAEQIGLLLKRQHKHLRQETLTPMVVAGELRQRYPDKPTHSEQAYTLTEIGQKRLDADAS